MVINTTFCVDKIVEDDFIQWAKSVYMETASRDCGMTAPLIMQVLVATDENTTNYAIQFRSETNDQIVEWIDTYQPVLLDTAAKKWGQKVLHFTTLMQEI